jgi:RNA polymerase sigma factor (sigma-70 family)
MNPIKVVIADDHALFREGLKRILSLEKDILVVGEAVRGDEVVKIVERCSPDVLLLDLRMPKGDLVQNLLDVGARNTKVKVLILTAFSEEEDVLNSAKGGARGYVLKGVSSTTLLQAIKTVHRGEIWVDKEIPGAEMFEEISRSRSSRPESGALNDAMKSLTKRELEILRLVAEGLSNDEIGKRVFISEKTVKTHLTNIFDKLKVNNRFKAALMIMSRAEDSGELKEARSGKASA